MKTIEFFFDFVSPYAYFANCRLPALAEKHGCDLVYKAIDLAAAKRAAGNTGPSTVQIPPKLRYVNADFVRWSKRYGVPFETPAAAKPGASAPPPPGAFDSSRANKGLFFARRQGAERLYVDRVFHATYGQGGCVGDDALLGRVAEELGWSPQAFFDFVRSDEADRLYDEATREAQDRGVFGVPTMMIGSEMWWGNDRLDLLEDHLTECAVR